MVAGIAVRYEFDLAVSSVLAVPTAQDYSVPIELLGEVEAAAASAKLVADVLESLVPAAAALALDTP